MEVKSKERKRERNKSWKSKHKKERNKERKKRKRKKETIENEIKLIKGQFCSFQYFSYPTFHYKHGIFFFVKYYSFILVVYFYCWYLFLQFFFFFFGEVFDAVHVYKGINPFLWFCKFVASSALPKYVNEWHYCYYI